MANTQREAVRKAPKTGARPALKQEPELPWDAQEDAANLLSGLPLLPDFEDEDSITSSLRAPADEPLHEPQQPPRPSAAAAPKPKKGMKLSEFVRASFEQRVYGQVRYQLRIGEPASKATGKHKTRAPLLLIPTQDGEPAILCGWLDVTKREAQIRSYGIMVLRHEHYHGDEPSISEPEYERFITKLMDTLFTGGLRVVLLAPDTQDFEATQFNPMPAKVSVPEQPAAVTSAPAKRLARPVFTAALGVVLAFALGMGAQALATGGTHALSGSYYLTSLLHLLGR
jgi:hypothetical protein